MDFSRKISNEETNKLRSGGKSTEAHLEDLEEL